MKKYFAIFAAVAILGMLAIYFVPNKKIISSPSTTAVATPQTTTTDTTTPSTTANVPTTATTTTPTTATTAKSGTYKDGSYNGSNIATRFGNVKIAITVSGGKITNVTEINMPSDDNRSVMISSEAFPILKSQTLAAQSANIDGVSGATYTSNGYAQSLQSAIDAAKV